MTSTTVEPSQKTRPLLAALGVVLAGAGALILPFAISVMRSPATPTSPGIDLVAGAVVVIIGGVAPLALGLWLLVRGAPWLPAAIVDRVRSMRSPSTWGLIGTRVFSGLKTSPLRRALLGAVVGIVAAIVAPRHGRWIGAFVAVTIYSIVDPLMNAFAPRWWLNTVKSIAGWLLLFVIGGASSDMDKLGEGAMVFIFPTMIYPIALGLSAFVAVVRWTMRPRVDTAG